MATNRVSGDNFDCPTDDMVGPCGPLAQYGFLSDPALADTQAMIAAEETMGDI